DWSVTGVQTCALPICFHPRVCVVVVVAAAVAVVVAAAAVAAALLLPEPSALLRGRRITLPNAYHRRLRPWAGDRNRQSSQFPWRSEERRVGEEVVVRG